MMPSLSHLRREIGCHQRLNEIAVSERGTFRGLTQILRRPVRRVRKPLNTSRIAEQCNLKEGLALHLFGPSANR